MCGIGGKLNFDRSEDVSPALIKCMANAMEHRGPDDAGYYVAGPVGLGFRRLSIIDLSTGHQPISNEDGSVWIVFNGEIYNYQSLKTDLIFKGHRFATETDTDVIVHVYEEFGPAGISKLRGMFAFAIWDSRQDVLLLARDRVGIKPLYYVQTTRSLLFASEIKALLADPDVTTEVAPAMIDRLLTLYYLPGEETLFRNVKKLPPGTYMLVKGGHVETHRYWDLRFEPLSLTMEEAESRLGALLEETVKLHMISDVPVGVLLSGGFDSTALLSFMAGNASGPLNTFTVGFSGHGLEDERRYARIAADRYGTKHHELTLTATDFQQCLSNYVWHMEEPICEPPAIALYYVSKLAADSVKVLISGEGGDEAFGGYPEYRNFLWLERVKSALGPLRLSASLCAKGINGALQSAKLARYAPLLRTPFESYYQSRAASPPCLHSEIYSRDFAAHVDGRAWIDQLRAYFQHVRQADRVNQMLYIDSKTWLPDELLLKADKITMANSVELRVPFLDHVLLEFAAGLPGRYKVSGLKTKHIAKRVLAGRVPVDIIKRRKAGFPVPYSSWLQKEMNGWVREVLLDSRTLQRGYFEKRGLESLISRNAEAGIHSKVLFTLIAFELWHRAFVDRPVALPITDVALKCC